MSTAITADWTEVEHNPAFVEGWAKLLGADVPPPRVFARDDLRALVGREPVDTDYEDWRWHISLASDVRLPSWGEFVAVAHELRPGVVFVVGVPPRSWWMNIHPNCLHLWETTDEHLVAQWRSESQGHTPS
jgi:hypothetical protein